MSKKDDHMNGWEFLSMMVGIFVAIVMNPISFAMFFMVFMFIGMGIIAIIQATKGCLI